MILLVPLGVQHAVDAVSSSLGGICVGRLGLE